MGLVIHFGTVYILNGVSNIKQSLGQETKPEPRFGKVGCGFGGVGVLSQLMARTRTAADFTKR